MKGNLASEAQRGYALVVTAEVYKLGYLYVFVLVRFYCTNAVKVPKLVSNLFRQCVFLQVSQGPKDAMY